MLGFAKLRLFAVTWTCLWLLTAAARAHAEELRLDNGLRVVLAPDATVNNVALVVSYEAGSANDPVRYRGMAHLLEHLTFRGSRHMRAQQSFDMIEASGGGTNAYTLPDRTQYVAVLPRAALPLGLWVERERMAFALEGIDQSALDLERKIVRNEMAQKEGLGWRTYMQLQRSLYGLQHAYASEDEAQLSDVDAITLPDVQWFFQSTHRPDNATLVVVGAFDPQEIRTLIERYFAPILNPKLARNTREVPAPKQCGVHRLELGHEYLEGRMLTMTWTLQRPISPAERMALRALQHVLDGGVSDEVVRGSFEAASVSVALEHRQTHSLMHVELNLHEQSDFEQVEARVMKVANELAGVAIGEAELSTLRGELVTEAVLAREKVLQRALSIAGGYDSIQAAELADALDAPSIQRAAAQLTGHRLVLAVRHSDAASDGLEILKDNDPCR